MSEHPIVHIEFSARDLSEAASFYSDVFGWETEAIPEMNYTTFKTPAGLGGGLNPVRDDNPAGTVIVYVGTPDIEAMLRKIEECGGKTDVPKTEIPGMGWFAIFSDPTGNRVGLFTEKPGM